MLFIDFRDAKFGTFFNDVFHNIVDEIGSKIYQQNCRQSFWDRGSDNLSVVPTNCAYDIEIE